jgi:hypothetical protein
MTGSRLGIRGRAARKARCTGERRCFDRIPGSRACAAGRRARTAGRRCACGAGPARRGRRGARRGACRLCRPGPEMRGGRGPPQARRFTRPGVARGPIRGDQGRARGACAVRRDDGGGCGRHPARPRATCRAQPLRLLGRAGAACARIRRRRAFLARTGCFGDERARRRIRKREHGGLICVAVRERLVRRYEFARCAGRALRCSRRRGQRAGLGRRRPLDQERRARAHADPSWCRDALSQRVDLHG